MPNKVQDRLKKLVRNKKKILKIFLGLKIFFCLSSEAACDFKGISGVFNC